jgi:hypothetical protein
MGSFEVRVVSYMTLICVTIVRRLRSPISFPKSEPNVAAAAKSTPSVLCDVPLHALRAHQLSAGGTTYSVRVVHVIPSSCEQI